MLATAAVPLTLSVATAHVDQHEMGEKDISLGPARMLAAMRACCFVGYPAKPSVPPAEPTAGALNAFAWHHLVINDGVVPIVPTPGHMKGHQFVLIGEIGEGDRSWLIAGDAVFDTKEIANGTIAGIAEDRDAARDTVTVLRRQMDEFGNVVVPAHDPDSALSPLG